MTYQNAHYEQHKKFMSLVMSEYSNPKVHLFHKQIKHQLRVFADWLDKILRSYVRRIENKNFILTCWDPRERL